MHCWVNWVLLFMSIRHCPSPTPPPREGNWPPESLRRSAAPTKTKGEANLFLIFCHQKKCTICKSVINKLLITIYWLINCVLYYSLANKPKKVTFLRGFEYGFLLFQVWETWIWNRFFSTIRQTKVMIYLKVQK